MSSNEPRNRIFPDPPPLNNADRKYKQSWLEEWLQKPTVIRRYRLCRQCQDGVHHEIRVRADEDNHPALSPELAHAVAEVLAPEASDRDTAGIIDHEMSEHGAMIFRTKGCVACHQIAPEIGGVSAAELYTVTDRLSDAYLNRLLMNPVATEPGINMPLMDLTHSEASALIEYFRLLSRSRQ